MSQRKVQEIRFSPPLDTVFLVRSETELRKLCAKHKLEVPLGLEYPVFPSARAIKTVSPKQVIFFIVCLGENAEEGNQILVASTLVHEAVHVWQWYVEHLLSTTMGEIGCEQMAYGIDGISHELFRQYAETIKGN